MVTVSCCLTTETADLEHLYSLCALLRCAPVRHRIINTTLHLCVPRSAPSSAVQHRPDTSPKLLFTSQCSPNRKIHEHSHLNSGVEISVTQVVLVYTDLMITLRSFNQMTVISTVLSTAWGNLDEHDLWPEHPFWGHYVEHFHHTPDVLLTILFFHCLQTGDLMLVTNT